MKYKWSHDEDISLSEYIRRLAPMVSEPCTSMWEWEGDMLLSDYRLLNEAGRRLTNLVSMLDNAEPKLKVVEGGAAGDVEEES